MPYVKKIINDSWKQLRKVSESPILDTELILAHALKKPREFVYAHPEYKLSSAQLKKFKNLISRRSKGEPVAYLFNHKEFYGLDFYVDKRVLIPRPETEQIVDLTLQSFDTILRYKFPSEIHSGSLRIVDVGTGSGCIAIAIKKYLPQCEVLATDISKPALEVARKNAKNNKTNIKFYHGSLLSALPKKYYKKIDLIVSNPPYLPANVAKKKSLKYEPQVALRDRKQTQQLLKQASIYLKSKGRIIYEGLNGHIYQIRG